MAGWADGSRWGWVGRQTVPRRVDAPRRAPPGSTASPWVEWGEGGARRLPRGHLRDSSAGKWNPHPPDRDGDHGKGGGGGGRWRRWWLPGWRIKATPRGSLCRGDGRGGRPRQRCHGRLGGHSAGLPLRSSPPASAHCWVHGSRSLPPPPPCPPHHRTKAKDSRLADRQAGGLAPRSSPSVSLPIIHPPDSSRLCFAD